MEVRIEEAELREHQDLVSVIVPIYNMEKHLDRCLESILGQTYQNIEILLIDDGSTDGSLGIINGYAKQDSRVRVFHKENGGVSSARNLGLEMMRGEYCTFVDPDDFVADVYVEWMLRAIEREHVQIATCNRLTPSENNVLLYGDVPGDIFIQETSLRSPTVELVPLERYSYFSKYKHLSSYCAMYQSNAIRGCTFDEDIYISEDALFFIQSYLKCKKRAHVAEKLYCYIQYETSAVHSPYSDKRWTAITAWNKIVELCKLAPPSVSRSAEAWFEMSCSGMLMDILCSPDKDMEKVQYLIRELRAHRRAISYIPKEKSSIRIRVFATVLFPRTTSYLLWHYLKWKQR